MRPRRYDDEMRALQFVADLTIACLFVLALGWGIVAVFKFVIGL